MDPRSLLQAFGTHLSSDTEVRVADSTADMRYMVLPDRPAGTDGEEWTEDALARLVHRDALIGVRPCLDPSTLPPPTTAA